MKIAVYCGSDFGVEPAYRACARALGEWIGSKGHTLVYGGGDAGIMGEVASAAFSAGSRNIGVLPGNVPFILERPQPYCAEVLVEENMSTRKQRMLELADAFIALPGGIGTLDEITEAITLSKIGVFRKPCILYNEKGYYEPLRAMLGGMEKAGFLAEAYRELVLFSADLAEIERFTEGFFEKGV